MKQKRLYRILLALTALGGFVLRLCNLTMGTDAQGLPVSGHFTVWLLAGWSALSLILLAALSSFSPGKSGEKDVLRCGGGLSALSYIAAVLILLSAGAEFGQSLREGADMGAPILCLLGLAAGLSLLGIANRRSRDKAPLPPLELIPDLYLVVKLVLNFRGWSTDPMILDYCVSLFALIFVNLAFYHSSYFSFGKGKPRRTLFYSMVAVYFSAAAFADGFTGPSWAAILEHAGFLLWLLPVTVCLLRPREAPPPETVPEDPAAPGKEAGDGKGKEEL